MLVISLIGSTGIQHVSKYAQFGFSLGGPVVKDKTFIFGSLEVI